VLCLIAASLTAYSRIYLSWHFFQDTLAGSLYGVLLTLLVYMIFFDSKNPLLNKRIRIKSRKKSS
jgi:membrane-associated phospholipid phosphatase